MESWQRRNHRDLRRLVAKPPRRRPRQIRLVRTLRDELGTSHGTVQRVANQLCYGVESVRAWVRQADINDGLTGGTTTSDAQKLKELEQEVKELRRANANAFSSGHRNGIGEHLRWHRPSERLSRADSRSRPRTDRTRYLRSSLVAAEA